MSQSNLNLHGIPQRIGHVLAVLAVVSLFLTPTVWAHSDHGRGRHHRKAKVKRSRVVEVYREPAHFSSRHTRHGRVVRAPEYITSRHAAAYRPYRAARIHFAPHRHEHAVYRFPVYRDGHYFLEPYEYCEGRRTRLSHVAYSGARISFGFNF